MNNSNRSVRPGMERWLFKKKEQTRIMKRDLIGWVTILPKDSSIVDDYKEMLDSDIEFQENDQPTK
jgi:hypothetical protein